MNDAKMGRSLELYFIEGKPDGMMTAEVFNWTGHVLMTPRTQIAKALQRPEAARTGVYLLIGERDGAALAYVGEAEDVGKRLIQQAASKDWWETALIITTAGGSLHKAHVKYLEARLVEIANDVGGMNLENGDIPTKSSLSEAHIANMEAFIDTLKIVLPALRIDMFLDRKRKSVKRERRTEDIPVTFELKSARHGLHATAQLIEGEFIVQEGSFARKDWIGARSDRTHYWKLYDDLVPKNVLADIGEKRVFTTNYAFSSTSAAGAVVTGRATRGPTSWKLVGTTQTYRDWEADQLSRGDSAS